MKYVEPVVVDDDATRQCIDAARCFAASEDAAIEAAKYSGGMVWKRVKGREYLVRTSRTGKQTSLGPRSDVTERLFESFFPAKETSLSRLASLKVTLARHVRMNRALRVGRVPNALVAVLAAVGRCGLSSKVAVIGSAALHAYETAAGVRLDSRLFERSETRTRARQQRVTLAIDELALYAGVTALLERIDQTFEVVDVGRRIARNGAGLEVQVVVARDTDRSTDERWQGSDKDLQWLARAPRFSEVVVGLNGRMARMVVADPRAMVLHLDWRTQQGRKLRVPEVAMAEVLDRLIEDHLPQLSFASLPQAATRSSGQT
jgi:hypothetical protein